MPCGQISSKRRSFNTLEIISTQPPTINLVTFCFFVLRLNSLKSSSHSEFSMKRTTQEKLREHLCIDKKKSISKITIAGVGQVGTACAYSIMQQVKPPLINIDLTRCRPLWSFPFQKHRCIFSTGNYLIFSLSY